MHNILFEEVPQLIKIGLEGILIKGHSKIGIAEEAPGAYKDVNHMVDVMHN